MAGGVIDLLPRDERDAQTRRAAGGIKRGAVCQLDLQHNRHDVRLTFDPRDPRTVLPHRWRGSGAAGTDITTLIELLVLDGWIFAEMRRSLVVICASLSRLPGNACPLMVTVACTTTICWATLAGLTEVSRGAALTASAYRRDGPALVTA